MTGGITAVFTVTRKTITLAEWLPDWVNILILIRSGSGWHLWHLIFLKGLGILIYVILWIVVPKARTTAEKLQMHGMPVTLSTIKESVNAEYDKVKSESE